ncbi:MAG TPA: NAD(P)-dependent oxidoreductase [Pantanalinema sp.]
MNIALIGATGFVGTQVLEEALRRGHRVTAIVRHPEKLPRHANLTPTAVDVFDAQALAKALEGTEAVVSAFNPGWGTPDIQARFIAGSRAITEAVKAASLKRLLVVGGAGSLFVAPGLQLVDTPEFPAEWKEGALGAREALRQLQAETSLDWTFLSPAILLEPGERTGAYRVGADEPLSTGEGPGRISAADLAVAILDEIERPQHLRKRFTVAY